MRPARKGYESVKRYVKLDDEMTESAAWTSLSDGAVWIYIELRKSFNFIKGGDSHLILPYSKVSWRMSRSTFAKRIQELIKYGFIKIVDPGGLLGGRPRVFALSEHWKRKSREIVTKEGREAIKSGIAKKRTSRDSFKNLIGKRAWEENKKNDNT